MHSAKRPRLDYEDDQEIVDIHIEDVGNSGDRMRKYRGKYTETPSHPGVQYGLWQHLGFDK